MNRIIMKENAKQQISGKIGTLLIMYIVAAVISGLLGVLPVVGPVISSVLYILFQFSLLMIYMAIARGEDTELSRLFDIFKNTSLCGNAIILNLLIGLFTFLWSLLFIVPGIIKGLSYSMAPYILAENEYFISPTDALHESIKMMEGHKMDLFMLQLSFIGWFLLCGITCGIATIYVVPYHSMAMVNFYNELKEQYEKTVN